MKKNIFLVTMVSLIAASFLSSCKKDEPENPENPAPQTGSMQLKYTPMFGDSILELNSDEYVTANGDTLVVSAFKFYVSNVVLTNEAGGQITVPESYFLINTSNTASQTITLNDIPVGNYTQVSFLIGIDSTRNVSGTQTGALDPSHGMFWTWNSGYIMAKLEGTSPQSNASMNMVMLHIGGFSGANSALRTVTLPLSTHAAVLATRTPLITVSADAAEWLGAPNVIDLSVTSTIMMPSATSASIADNYTDMFAVESVQN
jgi:hypothetical protein